MKLRRRRALELHQTYKPCSLLLCYPDQELVAARAGLAPFVPPEVMPPEVMPPVEARR